MLILCIWLQDINKVKVTHQGQSKISTSLKFYVVQTVCKWVVCIRLNAFLFDLILADVHI